jgi:hypothetical protein
MGDEQNKAAEYRREAASCLEVARRTSLREDRERMFKMAEKLRALAEKAEAEDRRVVRIVTRRR